MSSLSLARRLGWSTTAGLFGVLLLSLTAIDHLPLPVPASLFVLAALAAWRPDIGLTIGAGLIPIATWTGRTWDGALAWPEAVAVAILLGYAARQAFDRKRDGADAFATAIHVTIAIVMASVGVQLVVLHGTVGAEEFSERLIEVTTVKYFLRQSGFESLDAGMRLIEGLLLAHAGASVVRAVPDSRGRIVRAMVAGAVAASALNVWRVWLAALRVEAPILAFLRHLATLRFNTHYGDVNAAGSYFGMTLMAAVGLACATSAWLWLPASAIIGVSLILSGSRVALVATIAAAGLAWWYWCHTNRQPLPWRVRPATVVALLAAACAAALYLALLRNATPASTAFRIRAEFARASIEMLWSRPLFGIGVGRYPERLSEFASPGLMAVYPVERENAHNNFLQILGELGTTGFAAFICVLGIAANRILNSLRTQPADPLHYAVTAGLAAFVASWLTGHPLLVDDPAFSFWLLLGTAAAAGNASGLPSSSTRTVRRWALAAAIVVLFVSVPLRGYRELGVVDLEHLGIGLSRWSTGSDGVEYRLAGASGTVFVPADAQVIEVPLRAAQPGRSLQVEVYLDRQFADVLAIPHDTWHPLVIRLPRSHDRRRFRALELRVREAPASGDMPMLMIGKVRPRQ